MKTLIAAAAIAAGILAQTPSQPKTPPPRLRIVVIAGEDAVNVIQQKTAVAPIVEVRDRNDQPVAGAIVTFTIAGPNASFGGGLSTVSLTTNLAGRAAVAGLTPTGAGALQINVAAAFQGQTATAAIAQTNFATAAQAAASGAGAQGASAGGGSSGGIGGGTIAAIGAAAAGAGTYLALRPEEADGPVLSIGDVRVDPTVALQATHVFFSVGAGGADSLTETWDFGDGTTSTRTLPSADLRSVNHVYASAGQFTPRVTVSDGAGHSAQAQGATVTIKSMTGRWTIDAGGFIDVVQSGAAIAGTFTAPVAQNSGTLTGAIGPGEVPGFENFAPGVTFTITANNRGQTTFVGSVASGTAANGITGGVGTPSGTVVWRLTRQ